MLAKIMLLPGSEKGNQSCEYVEQLLTDIAGAFDHTFAMNRGKIGAEGSDQTVGGCESSQAVFLGDARCPGETALCDALGLPLRIRCLCVPEALCGRHERPVKLWFATVLSLDDETLRDAMAAAFRFAREEDARILHVSPAGGIKTAWDAAIRVEAAANPLISVDPIGAPEAAEALVARPDRLGLLLCPPYAGGILEAAATAACPHPEAIYDLAPDEASGVYAPFAAESADAGLSPFAAALAVARMLRYSLRLPREAACLEAAVQNVMANNDGKTDGLTLLERICDQVSVAGELMGKGGFAP